MARREGVSPLPLGQASAAGAGRFMAELALRMKPLAGGDGSAGARRTPLRLKVSVLRIQANSER